MDARERVARELRRTEGSWTDDPWSEDVLTSVVLGLMAEAWDEAVRTMATAGLINSSVLAYGGAPPNPYRSES